MIHTEQINRVHSIVDKEMNSLLDHIEEHEASHYDIDVLLDLLKIEKISRELVTTPVMR